MNTFKKPNWLDPAPFLEGVDVINTLNSRIPTGPLEQKWEKHKGEIKLVNPAPTISIILLYFIWFRPNDWKALTKP